MSNEPKEEQQDTQQLDEDLLSEAEGGNAAIIHGPYSPIKTNPTCELREEGPGGGSLGIIEER